MDPWEGELLCDHYSPSAIQRKPFEDPDVTEISEDCLYLNIWTPAKAPNEKLPVMFWIHGGGFTTGCGTSKEFDGDAFNNRGVILVTFNYRLGALGYIALPELAKRDGTTGNNGLLDQIAALKWVQANISAFGGDPDNITVFGFSAGGMSTRMLMCSPLSRDIMKRAIVESGSGITDSDYYRPLEEKMDICERGMKSLGWTLEDIMMKDASEVCDKLQDATIGELEFWEKSVFQPDTDGFSLLETPGVTIWKGEAADIPVISGSVSGDNGWIKIVRKDVPDENIVKRMGGRRACVGCGATYHLVYAAPKKEGICDNCGAELILRDDDKPETVQKRLGVYHEQTQPLIDYYTKKGILKEVDGTMDMGDVFKAIVEILGA